MLLERGAKTDIRDEAGMYPMMEAAFQDHHETVQLMLDAGADPLLTSEEGYTAMHFAAWEGHLNVVKVLVNHGVWHDSRTADGNTQLALACHGDYLPVIEYLLGRGCNVNNKDKDQDSAILYCSFNGNEAAVKMLIDHHADPDVRNSHQTTALWNAVYKRNWPMLRLLLEENVTLNVASRGIDQHSVSDQGDPIYPTPRTPIQVALFRNFKEVIPILVEASSDLRHETWMKTWRFSAARPHDLSEKSQTVNMFHWTQLHIRNPPSLKRICRTALRGWLGRPLRERVSTLGLPTSLVGYLCLEDLLPPAGVALKDVINYKALWECLKS